MDSRDADDSSVTRMGSLSGSSQSRGSSAFDEGGFTPGTVLLGRYRIVGLIGRGGMGEVYRAQDLKLGQSVALKFLPASVQRDPSRLERFLSEVRIARQISHPHVCRVYDVSDVDGRHFISMEFVDGEDLASLLRRIGRLPADKGTEVARQICAGLAAAHDRGVLHRDLKPANIMIDGRGHARLADFGLAAGVDDLRRSGDVVGTPAYMAPEQLEGQALSTRTDLYALGLVLHELFTGKRVFNESSIQELRDAHRKRGSTRSLASSTVDLDPAIERVIERCLEPDPQKRPPSALAVAAALPGGDPLAAALAAGETPSPELVAGAGSIGGLRPTIAWTLVVALVVGVAICGWFARHNRIYHLAPAMRSPEVLASRAEDLLDTIGYGGARADSAYGWRLNRSVVTYVRQHDEGTDRWDRVASADAPALQYWFRQSPDALVPYDYSGDVTAEDPPPLVPGMASVALTPRGRLVSFRAVAVVRRADAQGQTGTPDWAPLFAEAGIEQASLTPALPADVPPTFADVRAAWEGTYPKRPDWPMRIEAASFHGHPVLFEVKGPWAMAEGPATTGADLFDIARNSVQIWVSLAALVLGAWLARRNTRAGRADTRSALLVAVCAGAPLVAAWVIGTHHTSKINEEWPRFVIGLGAALVQSLQIWLVYVALEPYVRRRWPESLISWTRLLSGRVADPLVGRHVLIGLVAGIALVIAGDVAESIPGWLGQPPVSPTSGENHLRSLGPSGEFLGELVLRPWRVLSESLLILFLLLLGLIVLRNRWLAYAALVVEFVALAVNREAVVLSSLSLVLFVSVVVFLISRFGLLAYVAAMFALYTINDLPLTLEMSAWFAWRSAIVAMMLIGVGLWSFYTALAGQQKNWVSG